MSTPPPPSSLQDLIDEFESFFTAQLHHLNSSMDHLAHSTSNAASTTAAATANGLDRAQNGMGGQGSIVPQNLGELPGRLLDSVERMGNEIFDALNAYGPPTLHHLTLSIPPLITSITQSVLTPITNTLNSLPSLAPTPPPPPPPPPPKTYVGLVVEHMRYLRRGMGRKLSAGRIKRGMDAHPYVVSSIAVLGLSLVSYGIYTNAGSIRRINARARESISSFGGEVGVLGGKRLGGKHGREGKRRKGQYGLGGMVEDGMLKDAILILSPSPSPEILLPLLHTLLASSYIILLALPSLSEAESIERDIRSHQATSPDAASGSLRVLIYDPEDPNSLGPFQRSLWATLTLKFPPLPVSAPDSRLGGSMELPPRHQAGDPYAPLPRDLARLHSIVNLYALHPSPSQSGGEALPALPALLRPPTSTYDPVSASVGHAEGKKSRLPGLITFHHAAGTIPVPSTFAEQIATMGNVLLGTNLRIANPGMRIVEVAVGEIDITSVDLSASPVGRSWHAGHKVPNEVEPGLARPIRSISLAAATMGRMVIDRVSAVLGGRASRDWSVAQREIVRIVGKKRSGVYFIGQGSFVPYFLNKIFRPTTLSFLLAYTNVSRFLPLIPLPRLEIIPSSTANMHASSESAKRRTVHSASTTSTPTSEGFNVHEDEEDGDHLDSEAEGGGVRSSSAGSSSGLEGSWVGLGAEAEAEEAR